MISFVRYWMPVVLLCTAIFIQSAFPSPDVLPVFVWADKLLHLAVYAVLGALFCRAFSVLRVWNGRWWMLFLAATAASALYGLTDEWHQSFIAARSADWADWLADMAGSVIGSALYLAGVRRLRAPLDNP
jgi:VanZ family protein